MTYGANTELYYTEVFYIDNEIIKISEYDNRITFVWVHDLYHISGYTNLSKEELIKILTNLTFH